ncbi:outer membrane beta-barrel protein [Rubrolithibacter danxiaensis]|uniref:outer membrane beta-barrel protein n=1 Tax=Rubrolithibacter danxiaensis TaxID=3390805 RepID=UPI003BF819E6
MKPHPLLILVAFLFFSVTLNAQNVDFSIKGTVVDSLTKRPLDYITVSLKNEAGQAVKTALTKDDGSFSFSKLSKGKYSLTVIAVGYKAKIVNASLTEAKNAVDLGSVLISSQNKQLNEVVVTADRPLIKQEVDRIAYDVQADPESKVQNALDMMRKVPMITVDAEDNIKLKGNGNYKILINGRPSSMMARDPKEVLKSLPANTISKIEVITNPPAKYDAEGLAGIINIITNKKIDNGYNASLGTRYNSIWGPGVNTNVTIKGGKIGFSGYGGSSWQQAPARTFTNSRIGIIPSSFLMQNGSNKNTGNYSYAGGELSYEIDTLNLITGSFGLNRWNGDQSNSQISALYDQEGGSLEQSYQLNNSGDMGWNGFDLGLNYQLGFKRSKDQLLTGSYKYSDSKDQQFSELLTSQQFEYTGKDYQQENKSGSREQTFQLDYVHPVKKIIDIEGGLKAILRNNFSDFEYRNKNASGDYIKDENASNQFDHRQDVYSFYNSYNLKLKNWGLRAGLRLERTTIDANFATTNSGLEKSYNNFIPSISVQRKFKNMSSLNLGYTQRIQRPGIWQLNPFIDRSNPRFINQGNKDLDAVLNHTFDLGFSTFKKGSINLGLNYSFANNTIEYISELNPVDTVTYTTYKNIGKNKRAGINGGLNINLTKKLSMNLNGDVSYVWLEGFLNSKMYKNDGLQGNAYTYFGYSFDKNWRVSVNAGYYSGWLTLQGTSNPYIYSSASISKEFFDKKASLSMSVSNPFQKYREYKNDQVTPDFIQRSRYQNFYRSFNFGFNYRFGKLQQGIKKNKRGINNDDVQGKSSGGAQ